MYKIHAQQDDKVCNKTRILSWGGTLPAPDLSLQKQLLSIWY